MSIGNVSTDDPTYQTFLRGLKAVAADPPGQASQRWHPPRKNWVAYDPAKWGMEDTGAAPTPPGTALAHWSWPQGGSWTVSEFSTPGLFAELTTAYDNLEARHPGNWVWSPWGGTWRIAFERATPPPPPPPPGTPGPLPQEAQEKIALVEQMGRRGSITHAVEQAEIQRILDEYL